MNKNIDSKKDKEKPDIKRIVLEYPFLKHKEIKLAATDLGFTIKDFVDQAIKEKIENERKKCKTV